MHALKSAVLSLVATAAGSAVADTNAQVYPQATFGQLDHVFLIMMENQPRSALIGNPYAPFINSYAQTANQATQYFGVGHPSAPNYLEIVGGSNFGLTNDYWPNWISAGCTDNSGSTGCNNSFTPISGPGMDNPVVATAVKLGDCNGQIPTTSPVANDCALRDYAAARFTPSSIAHQLVMAGKSWKTYQESLPTVQSGVTGSTYTAPNAFGINYSDGAFSNLSPPASAGATSPFALGAVQKLYAVKHNPFAYFQDIELGTTPGLSLSQVVDFDGPRGLWADVSQLINAPNLFFIVPNQCHDMHGFVSGGTPICSTSGANAAAETNLLVAEGDAALAKIVNGIKASRVWKLGGRNAIVVVWDENDYSVAANNVVMLVETNYAGNGRTSNVPYDHFSLLRTLEAGFSLPCLNHACDATSLIMNDLFGGQ
jgi:phosphatidylinositol-3-phosphatase